MMFFVDLEVGYLVHDGLPITAFGPFASSHDAKVWYAARDPGDWEGTLKVLGDPALFPLN